MSGVVLRYTSKTEPNSKGHQTLKKFTSECCGLDLAVIFLVKSVLGKKAGCSLSTKSLCPCIVLSFKCTAKAPLIIKDWFKRLFHNLSKQQTWLMLHIISSCHLLLLCVYCASHSPSVPARICSREAGPPGLMAQLQPWAQQQQSLDWL